MRDLSATSGLPLALDEVTGLLVGSAGLVLEEPGVRRWGELVDVVADPSSIAPEDARPCYHLYRDVGRGAGRSLFRRRGLRYDLTVMLPDRTRRELPKTAGHYHSAAPDGITYPEVYEVLHGQAAFVLQRVDDPTLPAPRILDVWIAVCEPGERIVIPPDCGHVTVNIGHDPLVVSDLVADASHNDYGSFRHARGAAVYVVDSDDGPDDFHVEMNPRYADTPDPVIVSRSRWSPPIQEDIPVFQQARMSPERFRFLTHPASYREAMAASWTE